MACWQIFFMGAHAAVKRWPVLTRDTGRYQAYFPDRRIGVAAVIPRPVLVDESTIR